MKAYPQHFGLRTVLQKLFRKVLSHAPRLRRIGGYAAWTALGAMVPLALDRLIIHPYLLTQLDSETFGGFIWVLGIAALVANVASTGFVTVLIREYARFESSTARILFRSSLLLGGIATLLLLGIAIVFSVPLADETVRLHGWALYVPLCIYGFFRSLSFVLIAKLRIQRRFRSIFLLRLLEAVALLGVFAVGGTGSLWLIGTVYVLSTLIMLPFGAWWTRDVLGRGPWNSPHIAKLILAGCYAGAVFSLVDQSQVYVSRLMLGAMTDGTEVAILYAGTAMGNIFVLPVGILSNLVFSLLGGKKNFIFTPRLAVVYGVGVVGLMAAVALASWWAGRWLVTNRYPSLSLQTLEFYHWIAIANGLHCATLMCRPIALKYASLLRSSLLSAVPLVIQITLLAIYIPRAQADGAAFALATAAAFAAALWLAYFGYLCRIRTAEVTQDQNANRSPQPDQLRPPRD